MTRRAEIRLAPPVRFTFAGQPVLGHRGESVALALLRAGHAHLRDAPADGAPRGMFCAMGLCQECAVRVGGTVVEACRLPVAEGLEVERL